jgi:hypothetical protein
MVLTNDSRRMEFGGIHRPEAVMPPSNHIGFPDQNTQFIHHNNPAIIVMDDGNQEGSEEDYSDHSTGIVHKPIRQVDSRKDVLHFCCIADCCNLQPDEQETLSHTNTHNPWLDNVEDYG